jgi:hypothetical protein
VSPALSQKSADINLDALRAARAEAAGEFITVVFNGKSFTVKRELPYSVLRKVKGDDLDGALADLLGAERAEELLDSPELTLQDVNALLEGIVTATTGKSLGEASGSSAS